MWRYVFFLPVGLLLLSSPLLAAQGRMKTIIGRAETVRLLEWGIVLKAKIDTGAYRGSLHVSDLKVVDGNPELVRFQTVDEAGKVHTVEAPLAQYVKVKSSSGQVEKRPAVRMRLCLAGQEIDVLVSLADRSDMRFPMLIGRKFLKGRFLVDPALKYTHDGACLRPSSALRFP